VGNVAGAAVTAAANLADDGDGPNAYLVDGLFRAPAMPAAPAAPPDTATRGEVARIFANAATAPVPQGDADYLTSLVARQTGLSQAEAQARVDAALVRFEAMMAEAVKAAETARRMGVVAAFLTAAALFVSAAGAWWAASMGGRHRNEGTVFATFFRRY
jgi:hypothetical protein